MKTSRTGRCSATFSSPTPTNNDIAYDSASNLHVAWYDTAEQTLMYAVKSNVNGWSAPVAVEPTNTRITGMHVSIAVDPLDGVGIVYRDEGGDGVSGSLKLPL